jgi:hypothetical protein
MLRLNMVRQLVTLSLAALMAAALTATASAQGSIGAGIYTQSGNGESSTGGGFIVSTATAVPILPVSVGLTAFGVASRGGGYAVTLDGRFAVGSDAIGVGYGLGQFGAGHSGGTATLFFDHKVAPLTSIELRGYKTTGAEGSTAGFLGLKFSL